MSLGGIGVKVDAEEESSEELAASSYNYQSGVRLKQEHQLLRRLDTKEFSLKKRDEDLFKAKKEVARLQLQCEEWLAEKNVLHEANEKSKSSLSALQKSHAQQSKELGKEGRLRSKAEKKVAELESELKALEVLYTANETKNSALQHRLEELSAYKAMQDNQMNEVTVKLKRVEAENVRKEAELADFREQIKVFQMREMSSKDAQDGLEDILAAKNRSIQELTEGVKSTGLKLKEVETLNEDLQQELSASQNQLKTLSRSNEKLQRDYQTQTRDHTDAMEKLRSKVHFLEEDLVILRRQCDSATQELQLKCSKEEKDFTDAYLSSDSHLQLVAEYGDAVEAVSQLSNELKEKEKGLEAMLAKVRSCEKSVLLITQSKAEERALREEAEQRRKDLALKHSVLKHEKDLILRRLQGLEREQTGWKAENMGLAALIHELTSNPEHTGGRNGDCLGEGGQPKASDIDGSAEVMSLLLSNLCYTSRSSKRRRQHSKLLAVRYYCF